MLVGDRSRLAFNHGFWFCLAAAVVVSLVAVPAAAAEVATVGPDLGAEPPAAQACDPACTLANVVLPAGVGRERSPITGTITRWRGSFGSGDGPVRLQVLKRTHNESGTADDEFVAVRQTVDTPVPGVGIQAFDADLRIRKGQFIGVVLEGSFATSINLAEVGLPNAIDYIDFVPILTPGDPARTTVGLYTGTGDDYLLYNATVRR